MFGPGEVRSSWDRSSYLMNIGELGRKQILRKNSTFSLFGTPVRSCMEIEHRRLGAVVGCTNPGREM